MTKETSSANHGPIAVSGIHLRGLNAIHPRMTYQLYMYITYQKPTKNGLQTKWISVLEHKHICKLASETLTHMIFRLACDAKNNTSEIHRPKMPPAITVSLTNSFEPMTNL